MNREELKIFLMQYIRRDASESEQRAFRKWLISREHESDTDEAMRQLWAEEIQNDSDFDAHNGLERLHQSISSQHKQIHHSRYKHYISVASISIILFVAGYLLASMSSLWTQSKEVMLITAKDNVGEFTLPDGTHVWLNGDSRLKYQAPFSGPIRKVELQGEAYFQVAKNPRRPFHVRIDHSEIRVLGTSFNVCNYPNDDFEEIVLKEGAVMVFQSSTGKSTRMKPGQKLQIFDSGMNRINHVDADNYCQWYTSRQVFDNCSLADVLTNLEHRFRIRISVTPEVSLQKNLSFTVYHESLEEILDVLQTLIPVRCRQNGNQVFISSQQKIKV